MAAALEDRRQAHGRAGLVILLCLLVAALEGYDIQAFGVVAPKLAAELHLGPGQVGWVGSAAMIGLVFGALFGGWIADRIGRKPVLVASAAAFGLFSLATARAHGYEPMLAARFATGVGFGGAMPNLIAVATEISGPGKRAATVTTMFCGMPAGGAAVAFLARYLGAGLQWRDVFLIGGALPLLLTPLLFFLLPETRPAPAPGADRGLARALFAEGRAAGTLLIWAAFGLTLATTYLMLNWLPTLVIAKGLAPSVGAEASMAFNLTSIVGSLLLGMAIDRAGFRWPLSAAFAALALAMFLLATATGGVAVLVLSAIAGFMVLGAQFALYAIAPDLYPPQVRAAGTGAAVGVGRLGSIAGPLIAGQLREAGYSAGQVFAAMTPVVLAAGAAALALSYLSRPHVAADDRGG
jgi:AAHS family 3-hydroxyphenylpropionic acid transporter